MNRKIRIYKLAQNVMLNDDIDITGKGISEIIKFLMRKIPYEKRPHMIMKIKKKIWELSEYDIASKKSPDTASIGQAITFVKTLLNGKEPGYIRSVISSIIRNL